MTSEYFKDKKGNVYRNPKKEKRNSLINISKSEAMTLAEEKNKIHLETMKSA